MKISQGILKKHFPSDNRFIHYVLRKNGRVVRSDETILSVRHKALVQVIRAANKEKEFDDEAHITNYIMLAIDRAYCGVLRDSNLLKNNYPQHLHQHVNLTMLDILEYYHCHHIKQFGLLQQL